MELQAPLVLLGPPVPRVHLARLVFPELLVLQEPPDLLEPKDSRECPDRQELPVCLAQLVNPVCLARLGRMV